MRYESTAFGAEYRDNLFAALFNLHKVTRHVLKPRAERRSRPRTAISWSRPTTIFIPPTSLEDADGSLLVIDTGGWYKLCCPTSQLVKPDVLGGIYRVRKDLAAGRPTAGTRRQKINEAADHWGKQIDWSAMPAVELLRLLHVDRPALAQSRR